MFGRQVWNAHTIYGKQCERGSR